MALRERPINADLPPPKDDDKAASAAKPPTQPPTPKPKAPAKRRRPIPTALKGIAGLFVLAVVFIVAAIVGGGGGDSKTAETPAPVSEAPGTHQGAPAAQTPDELGYPAFATANTTRVGGSDSAATAAAVALAAFPSAAPSQQPAAVTLVNGEDWRSAIAASVLMAPPVRAPVLISAAEEVPDPTGEALGALDPQGSKATKGIRAFAIGGASAPSALGARSVGNRGGVAAAAAIASLRDELLGGPPRHILIASASQPGFAMPAAAWAARSGDPVLFADQEELPQPTAAALERHRNVPVYVLGPSSAISSDVVRQIDKISGKVRRVSGEDPIANAIALARYSSGGFGWNVNDPGHGFVVAAAGEPLDAAAAAALSASGTWGPLLLTDSADTLPSALRGYLLDVKPGYTTDPTRAFYNHVWVIGDQEAISVTEQAEIDELAALTKVGGEG